MKRICFVVLYCVVYCVEAVKSSCLAAEVALSNASPDMDIPISRSELHVLFLLPFTCQKQGWNIVHTGLYVPAMRR